MNTSNTNFPIVSVERAISILSHTYRTAIKKNVSPKVIPSVMLWGPPGVGKSQAVRQVAREIEEETGKSVNITDVRLLLFNPIDLRGIPTSNADKTLAVWLKPQIFQMNESSDVINILFLDEISAAPQSVQAAAYQITLDRVVGEHSLPDNCIVIAAGNRVTDKSVAYKMPKALSNRLLHLEINGSFHSWQRWAVSHGINEKVLGYLSFRNDRLFGFDASNDDLAFATPRSWEMVSNLLNNISGNVNEMYPMIAGLIGSGAAIEFRSWCNVYRKLPSMEDVFSGRTELIPDSTDAMYAVVSAMTEYAREHKDDLSKIGHSLNYAKRLPGDFVRLLIDNYIALDKDYGDTLMRVPEYLELARTRGIQNNGAF